MSVCAFRPAKSSLLPGGKKLLGLDCERAIDCRAFATRTGVRCLRRDRPFPPLTPSLLPCSPNGGTLFSLDASSSQVFPAPLFCRLTLQQRRKQLLQMSCVTLSRGDCMQSSSKVCKSESMTDTGSLSPPITPSKSIRSGSTFSFPSAMLFTGNWIASQRASPHLFA